MSYILEALRKSEAERTRGEPPDIATVQQVPAPRPGHSPVLALLTVVLLINAGLFGYWLLQEMPAAPGGESATATADAPERREQEPRAARMAAGATEAADSGPPGTTGPASQSTSTSVAEVAPKETTGKETTGPTQPMESTEPIESMEARAGRRAAGAAQTEPVPLMELPASLRARLPRLSISTHIYSEDPSLREVTINGQRFVPGQQVTDSVRLERITADGIVLAVDGRRFRMRVLEEWGY